MCVDDTQNRERREQPSCDRCHQKYEKDVRLVCGSGNVCAWGGDKGDRPGKGRKQSWKQSNMERETVNLGSKKEVSIRIQCRKGLW